MITESNIIEVRLSPSEMAYLRKQAVKAQIGGRSHVRGAADRKANLAQDQTVGLTGHYAAIRELFGNPWLFRLQRHFADVYPLDSDGGSDIPGARLDVKSSLISRPDLLSYHLIVRPKELHRDMTYLLALVELDPKPTVFLLGWASSDMLPRQPEATGPFAGAHVISARDLHPLMRLHWFEEAQPQQAAAATHTPTTLEVPADAIRW